MEKINIVEILKNCPPGMELNCTMYDNVYFDRIDENDVYPIRCYVLHDGGKESISFTSFGTYAINKIAKCVIFPKNKTTWKGFVPPCKFKDGDIVTYKYEIGLVSMILNKFDTFTKTCHYHCTLYDNAQGFITNHYIVVGEPKYIRYATEEEKQQLFDAIKEQGYEWNAETKTLEELIVPKFKVGDRVRHKQSFISGVITNIDNDCYKIKYDSGAVSFTIIKYQDEWKLVSDEIKPKFKIGDKIRHKLTGEIHTVIFVLSNGDNGGVYDVAVPYNPGEIITEKSIDIKYQDDYELVSDKFDISTLKPFESKVLVRSTKVDIWKPAIFGCCVDKDSYFVLGGLGWRYCIPYEGNEHLRGKSDDCDEYYKTWE